METWTDECGDSNCILRDPGKPRGMCTNGGCQHLKARSVELTRMLMAMGAEIVAQRRELEAARAVVEAAGALADEVAWQTNGDVFLAEPRHPLTAPTRRVMEAMHTYAAARGEKAGE